MRFALCMFGIPAVLVAAALLLASMTPQFQAIIYLAALADSIRYVSWALMAVAAYLAGYNLFRVWRAQTGNDNDACEQCNMPTTHKDGRYGPYFKCWSCGTNRADRY
jgi:hypothetical protein